MSNEITKVIVTCSPAKLVHIAEAASDLRVILATLSGPTADWPIQIHCDCPIVGRRLKRILTRLEEAIDE